VNCSSGVFKLQKVTNAKQILSLLIFALLAFSSCDKSRLMEENSQINDYNWSYNDVKSFSVEIPDTNHSYNIILNVRHSFNFEWRNMWVNIETVFPDSTKFDKRVNLLLSEPDGHWFGNCLGDNCDIQVPIQKNAYFPQTGKYTFNIRQDMRVDPLPLVKSVGLRIEKFVAEK
jgi:gliding motility-associated lipoprotein GldH